MKPLTKKQIKAVEKLRKKFNFYEFGHQSGTTNGRLLELIRYCKRLKP